MPLAVLFFPPSMNAVQYDSIIHRLERAGAGTPKGRSFHACYGTGNQLRIFDIWDTKESFNEFGKILMPLLVEMKLDPGPPQIMEVNNIIKG